MNSLNWLLLFGLFSLFINALYAQSETSEDSEDSTGEDSGDVTTSAADDSSSGNCDYIFYWPSGSCSRAGSTGSGSISYTCATASTYTVNTYTSDDCTGTVSSTATGSSSDGLPFSCGTGVTCESFAVTIFSNSTTCSDPTTFDYVTECIDFGVASTMASCDGSSVNIKSYASGDCSGLEVAGEFTDDCTVTCSGSANTISVVMGFCVMLIGLIWSLH